MVEAFCDRPQQPRSEISPDAVRPSDARRVSVPHDAGFAYLTRLRFWCISGWRLEFFPPSSKNLARSAADQPRRPTLLLPQSPECDAEVVPGHRPLHERPIAPAFRKWWSVAHDRLLKACDPALTQS
jgi:hypothetical protein